MLYINTAEEFSVVIQKLKTQKVIGIDTEFMRRDTYFAKLCLIQISTYDDIFVVDPLSFDISEFKEILLSETILKIFHAPNQDLGIFYNVLKVVTMNVFDVQEAVKFLGIRNQISYSDACEKILGVKIEKAQQYREWNIRPLPEDMKEYAGQDVKYLIQLYNNLRKKMEEKLNFINFCHYMESFSKKEFYQIKFDEIWKKMKIMGKSNLINARLKELAAFREVCAIELNLPRVHVISDEDLCKVAEKLPCDGKSYKEMNLRSRLTKSQIDKFLDICAGLKIQQSHIVI